MPGTDFSLVQELSYSKVSVVDHGQAIYCVEIEF